MNTLFYLSDMGENFKSAVDKIVKAHPYLKSFEFINSDMITPPEKCLSNFSIEWGEGNPNSTSMPIPNEVLLEIAVGIPKPYLLSCATFIFNAIDWYRDGRNCNNKPIPNLLSLSRSWKSKKPLAAVSHSGPQFPHTFLSSSIILQSDWWITRRHKSLWAIVEIEPPKDDVTEIAELNDEIRLNLSKLGRIKNELMILAPTEDEKRVFDEKKQVAEQLLINIDKVLMDFVNDTTLPYERNDTSKQFIRDPGLSVKGSIIKTFNKRGYNYYSNYSGQGIYTIAKKTDYNSQIRLMFDIGSHGGGRLSCTYFYEGHLWSVSFELIICKETPHKTGYYSDQNDIDRILKNVGIITDFLEKTLIIELKKIFGRVPLWYQYQK